jgi:hypothetical protein
MALEIIRGESENRQQAEMLAKRLSQFIDAGTLYLGYPILSTPVERVQVDGLLISESSGLVAFKIASGFPSTQEEWEELVLEQNNLYAVLESYLGGHLSL